MSLVNDSIHRHGILVENLFASLEVVDDPDFLLASLADDESVAGRPLEEPGRLLSDGFGLGAFDFLT